MEQHESTTTITAITTGPPFPIRGASSDCPRRGETSPAWGSRVYSAFNTTHAIPATDTAGPTRSSLPPPLPQGHPTVFQTVFNHNEQHRYHRRLSTDVLHLSPFRHPPSWRLISITADAIPVADAGEILCCTCTPATTTEPFDNGFLSPQTPSRSPTPQSLCCPSVLPPPQPRIDEVPASTPSAVQAPVTVVHKGEQLWTKGVMINGLKVPACAPSPAYLLQASTPFVPSSHRRDDDDHDNLLEDNVEPGRHEGRTVMALRTA